MLLKTAYLEREPNGTWRSTALCYSSSEPWSGEKGALCGVLRVSAWVGRRKEALEGWRVEKLGSKLLPPGYAALPCCLVELP